MVPDAELKIWHAYVVNEWVKERIKSNPCLDIGSCLEPLWQHKKQQLLEMVSVYDV